MTIRIHLGVVDIPYAQALQTAGRPGKPPAPSRTTTGDVAQYIEARYHLMQEFAEARRDKISEVVLGAMRDRIEALHEGRGRAGGGPLLGPDDLGDIAEEFRRMIDDRAFDGLVSGVPTEAARAGVNHRLLHPYAKSNPARPSFVDTGLYQSMMRAWSD